nr:NAD(P)/FAD-dependent oxidoreductase [Desulfobulbaceae bacterium]
MEKFHVIIVGAGPAGLCCAKHLAQNGVKVLVLEKNSTVGPKVCAGGIPFQAQKELAIPEHLVQRSFPLQRVQTPWQKATIASTEPIIITVDRYEFGQWMLAEALQAGATVKTNSPVKAITGKTVQTKETTYHFNFLVGADGSSSIVRRYLKIPTQKTGVGINYQIPTIHSDMEWHLDPSCFRSGYAWAFPHRETTSVGAYAERNNLSPRHLKNNFLHWAQANYFDLQNTTPQAALINFDYQGWKFNNIFLAGDAAGLASGFTGEGIYPAILSGETIAKTIIDAQYKPIRLADILRRHKSHQQIQNFFCGSKVICQISLEMLVLSLRFKLLPFRLLELY